MALSLRHPVSLVTRAQGQRSAEEKNITKRQDQLFCSLPSNRKVTSISSQNEGKSYIFGWTQFIETTELLQLKSNHWKRALTSELPPPPSQVKTFCQAVKPRTTYLLFSPPERAVQPYPTLEPRVKSSWVPSKFPASPSLHSNSHSQSGTEWGREVNPKKHCHLRLNTHTPVTSPTTECILSMDAQPLSSLPSPRKKTALSLNFGRLRSVLAHEIQCLGNEWIIRYFKMKRIALPSSQQPCWPAGQPTK